MKHRISIQYEIPAGQRRSLSRLIRRCIEGVLKAQGISAACEINVLLTDNKGMHALNLAQRNVDRPTDVLSFPMFEFSPGHFSPEGLFDVETGLIPLGDMAISLERAAEQAKDYGHSLKREVGYLTVHSVLHLLGYDHLDDGPQKQAMRQREEAVLLHLGLFRK